MELVGNHWDEVLDYEYHQEYFKKIVDFINQAYKEKTVFPPKSRILRALNLTDYDDVKVVILGQDPYHGEGQAHGLSFSVPEGQALPPSLKNIFRELQTDLGIHNKIGCLQTWADQGVLLLNTVLTVRAGEAFSHAGQGWEHFTDAILSKLFLNRKHIIFVLWGSAAKKKCDLLFQTKHQHAVLACPHPSPLAAHRGFFGCCHFSKINYLLKKQGKPMINWKTG